MPGFGRAATRVNDAMNAQHVADLNERIDELLLIAPETKT